MDRSSEKEEQRGSTVWLELEAWLIGVAVYAPALLWLWSWVL
ncbi:hypothetical protein [uncultured Erythrobacter sp.]|nr:hypothetical protein [uncultured Erythrobacter sp.]